MVTNVSITVQRRRRPKAQESERSPRAKFVTTATATAEEEEVGLPKHGHAIILLCYDDTVVAVAWGSRPALVMHVQRSVYN